MTLTPQQQSDLGVEAARVLANPAFGVVWERMRAEIVTAWSTCDVRDQAGQQLLLQQMKLVERLRHQFVSAIEAGKAADAKLRIQANPLQDNADLVDEGIWQHGLRAVRGAATRARG
jgi:hypothetical protein